MPASVLGFIKELFVMRSQSTTSPWEVVGQALLSLSGLVPLPEQMRSEGTVANPGGTSDFYIDRRMARPYASSLLRGEH